MQQSSDGSNKDDASLYDLPIPDDSASALLTPDDDEDACDEATDDSSDEINDAVDDAVKDLTKPDTTTITDSPIDRMTIAQLTLDQLDAELERIRVRRLLYATKLKRITGVKADVRWQQMYIKFTGTSQKVKDELEKLDKKHDAIQISINKLRAMLLEMGELTEND